MDAVPSQEPTAPGLAVSRASIDVARTDEHEEEIVVHYRLPAGLRSHALAKS